ncbi:MAG: ribosome biogenesis GTPase YlqF [Lachnospiraceae bacterium]|nr:ribosome biogenesis GTPase YlqF [Lachnospiraceae bacterium]MBQ9593377.1 ribosome biogenesis GTPase YlqF [Lachnospiraceae bacterium]MBR0153677.1 ribosome biogenesis GTPase YlqF [Lachnospiraceae bacterium]
MAANTNIQWYPGHMTKARRMMEESVKLIDIVVELVDARIPASSKNPDIDELAKGKARLILLNKADLADAERTAAWMRYYESRGWYAAALNARQTKDVRSVAGLIQESCREITERNARRGIKNRPIRAMIVGIPNVGKSTFINSFAGRAAAKTGNTPGVTKGKQWIRLNKNVELLDTPGILWPKFEDQKVGMRLAWIGSIRDEVLDAGDLAFELIQFLKEEYPSALRERYGLEGEEAPLEMMEKIGQMRGCLKAGAQIDYDKTASVILDDFRKGALGRITAEVPGDE